MQQIADLHNIGLEDEDVRTREEVIEDAKYAGYSNGGNVPLISEYSRPEQKKGPKLSKTDVNIAGSVQPAKIISQDNDIIDTTLQQVQAFVDLGIVIPLEKPGYYAELGIRGGGSSINLKDFFSQTEGKIDSLTGGLGYTLEGDAGFAGLTGQVDPNTGEYTVGLGGKIKFNKGGTPKKTDIDPVLKHHYKNIKYGKTISKRRPHDVSGTLISSGMEDYVTQTVRTRQVEHPKLNKGKPTLIPLIYDGKELSEKEAIQKAIDSGIKWTSADTHEELREYDKKLHKQMSPELAKGTFKKGGTTMKNNPPVGSTPEEVAMHEQMEMFENGGLKDQGGTLDPISGNEVPSGSLKEEVRDDIDAKLSPGEFVFPADVVRFIGLSSLMKMRDKAKAGLAKMEAMGQMGNSEDATLPDDVPFEMSDLIIVAEGGGGMGEADPKMNMYQGGVSRYSNGGLQEEAANKVRNDIDKLLEDVPLDKRAETIAYIMSLMRNHLEPPKDDWEKQKRAYQLKYLEEQLYLAENVDLSQPPLEAADHFDKAEPIRLAQTAIDSAMLDTPASKTDSPPNVNMGSSNGRLQEKVRNDIDQQLNNMPLKERAKQNVNTDSSNIVNGGWKYKVKRDPAFESALPKPVERGEPVERVKPLINITTKTTNEPTKLSQSDSDSARLDTPPGKAIRQQMEDMGVGGEADPRVEDEDAEVTISIKDLRNVMKDAISIAKSDPDAPEFFEHPEGRPDLNKGGVLKYAEGGGGMGEADPKVDRGSELLGSNLQQYFHPETKDVKFFLMHTNPVTRQREPINPLPGYVVDTPRNRASVGKKAPTQTKPTTTKVKSELESTGEEKGVGGGSVSDVSFGEMTQSEKADFSRDTKGPFGGLISGVSDVMGGVAEMAFSPGPLGVAGAKALGTLTGTEIDTSLGFMGMPEKQRAEAAQALAEQKAMNPSELKAQRARDEEKVEKRAAEAYDHMMGAPVGTSVGAMTSQGALAVDMQTGLVTDPVDGAVIKGALEKEAHDKVGFGKDAAPTTSETYSMTGGLSDYGPDVGGEPGTRGGIDTYKGGFIPKRKKQKKMKRGGLASR